MTWPLPCLQLHLHAFLLPPGCPTPPPCPCSCHLLLLLLPPWIPLSWLIGRHISEILYKKPLLRRPLQASVHSQASEGKSHTDKCPICVLQAGVQANTDWETMHGGTGVWLTQVFVWGSLLYCVVPTSRHAISSLFAQGCNLVFLFLHILPTHHHWPLHTQLQKWNSTPQRKEFRTWY